MAAALENGRSWEAAERHAAKREGSEAFEEVDSIQKHVVNVFVVDVKNIRQNTPNAPQ